MDELMMADFPYEQETFGVVVRVLPEYLEDRSSPDEMQFFWRYTVEIENGVEEPIKLMSRHWIITDEKGRRQEIKGDGVVGEQPILSPGERYTYASGCPLTEPSGMMLGTYSMQREDGEEFRVSIPAFSLDSPYHGARLN